MSLTGEPQCRSKFLRLWRLILASSSEKPIHLWQVERFVLNALLNVDAALSPKFDIEQRFAGNAQKILRLWRLILASSSEKPIHLSLSVRRWNALSSTRWQTDAASPPNFPKA